MSKAKRRLTNISFDHEGAHVALVSKVQGGPANGQTTLITKAVSDITEEDVEKAQVRVTLDFEEFLCRFFGMWYDDAEVLATFLGMDSDEDEANETGSYQSYIEQKVSQFELLKSLKDGKSLTALSPEEFISVKKAQEKFEPLLLAVGKIASNKNPDILKSKVGVQSLETIEKSLHEKILKEEIEKAVGAAKAELEAELTKANEKIAEIEKAAEAKKMEARKARLSAVANPEKTEELLKSTAALDDAAFDTVAKSLEIAAKTAETTDLFKEQGADNGSTVVVNGTAAILKSKYNK